MEKLEQEKLAEHEDVAEQASNEVPQEDSTEQVNELDNLVGEFADQVRIYSENVPDFGDAFRYLVEMRDKQLRNYSLVNKQLDDAQQRNRVIEAETIAILQNAKQAGLNAAEAIYAMARQFGYGEATLKAQNDNLQTKMAAQQAAKTLASGSGAALSSMTLEGLAAMSQEDFEQWYWKNRKEFKRIMGR